MVNDILAVAPPVLLTVVGMVVLLLDLWVANKRILSWLSLGGSVFAAFAAVVVLTGGEARNVVFGGGILSDDLGNLFNIVLCIVAALSILMSERYLAEKNIDQGEYYALILLSTAGAMVMAMANDLVNVFLGLEVLSLSLYILSGLARREPRSQESAVKYFLLGSFASGFLLYGIALLYGSVGLTARHPALLGALDGQSFTNFDTIREALRLSTQAAADLQIPSSAQLAVSPLFVAGIALLIVGLGFKAAIVPFHSWTPDVYEGAPTSVTAFMSAAAKAGAFAAFIRVFEMLIPEPGAAFSAQAPFQAVLWGLAAATMIVGNVLAVRQSNIKRMLAYSSIAHAGYMLVGIVANNELSRGAVLFYMFAYTFMNLGAFAVVIWLGRRGGEYIEIRDYAGLAKQQPLAAAAMAVFMLSLAGIPPAAGFFGKLYLFLGAVQAGQYVLAALGLVASVIGVFYYLNIIVQMYFRAPEQDFSDVVPRGGARVAAIVAAAGSLVLGIITIRHFTPTAAPDTAMRQSLAPTVEQPDTPASGTALSQR